MRALALGLLVVGALAVAAPQLANAETPKPVKVDAAEAAGPIFKGPKATTSNDPHDGRTTDVGIGKSADKRFTAGLYQAGPSDYKIEAYPVDEFCYFISGSVKLTSADGTVLDIKAGDAFMVPKGWQGRWQTPGYSKYYVIYDSAPAPK